ncbi:MAG: hypothetical protein AAFR59_09680, partial [Bacteroidota bacterium]
MIYWQFQVLGIAGSELQLPWAKRWRLPEGAETTLKYYEYDKVFYDQDYPLKPVELEEGSTEVDFISGSVEIGGLGLILSEKALQLLEAFQLPPHEKKAVEVLDENGKKTQTS